ncbi:hypothetical protein [Citrobacter amalonaticus]
MKLNNALYSLNKRTNWITIKEAVEFINQIAGTKLTDSDIYRYALYGDINLSIYFQSSVILRKVSNFNGKIKVRTIDNTITEQLCFLYPDFFINKINFIVSTEGKYISPAHKIIDTNLIGFDYVDVQRLLASSLNIPSPVKGVSNVIPGVLVNLSGDTYLVYEKITWHQRVNQQIMRLQENITPYTRTCISNLKVNHSYQKEYFPIYHLPTDACFVIRYSELEKIISKPDKNIEITPTRISTPLSRLFWLVCKHNETISPLLKQPYKLLSIFEQWASSDGITDHFSGDTIKNALERGSPASVSKI